MLLQTLGVSKKALLANTELLNAVLQYHVIGKVGTGECRCGAPGGVEPPLLPACCCTNCVPPDWQHG